MPQAQVARSRRNRTIHVDTERVTFHLRAESDDDFEKWTAALRRFTSVRARAGATGGPTPGDAETNMATVADLLAKMTGVRPGPFRGRGYGADERARAQPLEQVDQIAGHLDGSDDSSAASGPKKGVAKLLKPLKRSTNGKDTGGEADDLHKVHAKLFRYHQQLLEVVSPSRAAGALGPEEGAQKVDASVLASRGAVGFGGGGDDDDEDGGDIDLDKPSRSDSTNTNPDDQEGSPKVGADDDSSDSDSDGGGDDDDDGVDDSVGKPQDDGVKRRDRLPKQQHGKPDSALSLLRQNIGKDLSKISVRGLLERACR